MPTYTLVLMRGPGAAQERERLSYDSGEEELQVGDTVEVYGQRWQLSARQVFPTETAPDDPGFAAVPVS